MKQYDPPPHHDIVCDIFSTAGWIKGTFMVPRLRNLVDFLNQQHDFFKLKNVTLPGLEKTIEFFALQKSSIVLIQPGDLGGVPIASGAVVDKTARDVSCAFNSGVVSGTLETAAGARVSDFLIQNPAFFALAKCSLVVRTACEPEVRRDIPWIIPNARRVIGVSEPRFV